MTWLPVLTDDFTTFDSTKWYRYNGVSSASGSQFDPSLVSVVNGNLQMSAQKQADGTWHSSGVGSKIIQQYGSWRVTTHKDRGHGTTLCLLLWHASGTIYSEIDFAEDNGADATSVTGTLHWTDSAGIRRSQSASAAVDETVTHEYRVDWTPIGVALYVDGWMYLHVTDPTHCPQTPMYLGMQTEAWATPGRSSWEHLVDTTTPSPCSLYIDKVSIYAYQP